MQESGISWEMSRTTRLIDKVRASREGHEFHEAWTARRALQLLWPDSDLRAIAIEGLSPRDQAQASAATVEIADITLYYGARDFEHAAGTTVAQFKYSIANRNKDFRASDARNTIQKFAAAYREYKRIYGAEAVREKLNFQLVTNQPIYASLQKAVKAIAAGAKRSGETGKQAKQFEKAAGLSGKPLAAFAAKCSFIGRSSGVVQAKNELASVLVDWSATSDSIARARLGQLRDLVRTKAGDAGTGQNLIERTDILAALQIGDAKDLLPCESALVDVGEIVEREQTAEALAAIATLSRPFLIHAAGGVGKTVFMTSLATAISKDHEVVFFDCFGGGAYRSPEDARHLPRRGLVHLANTLAFRGLCDPLLPDSPDIENLLRTFRRRLVQCIETMSRMSPGRELAIFIDAIDNAELAARQRSEDAFPIKLLESLDSAPIPGLKVIVSCRSERKPATYTKFQELHLRPFSLEETAAFLKARISGVTRSEIRVAQARSGGNPRVLDYLLSSRRGLLDESEVNKPIALDELIEGRIDAALSAARVRGYEQQDIDAFLAGLAVLPPPVPLDEYAGAHKLEVSAIESFAADLTPLLERTNHGLMFRDEPTETLVHRRYASSTEALRRVAANLLARQDTSVYAARALPGLLHQLNDGQQLFALAFDDRIPTAVTSTVGRRNIRYARLKAATLHAAFKKDYNQLVRLLMELSTVAAVDQRGADYILDRPDLVIVARDVDARRRLFEARTGWPGTRHARLTIANALSGDLEEAHRNAVSASEWISHDRRTKRNEGPREPGPEQPDIAAIALMLIAEDRAPDAAHYLQGWRNWYVYEIGENLFNYTDVGRQLGSISSRQVDAFIGELGDVGILASALSFQELSKPKRKQLINALATLCKKKSKLFYPDRYSRQRFYELPDGLRRSAAIALSHHLRAEALAIASKAPHKRPSLWTLKDAFYHHDVFPFVFHTALVAAVRGTEIHEKDVLPADLAKVCSSIRRTVTGDAFSKKANELHDKHLREKKEGVDGQIGRQKAVRYEERQHVERFLGRRLQPLLSLTRALSAVLAASARGVDQAFVALVKGWEEACKSRDPYHSHDVDQFFLLLGLDVVMFALWARNELSASSVERFLTELQTHSLGAHSLIRAVAILARRAPLQSLAGALAVKTRTVIDAEDDVTQRAMHYGGLARAMLPASIDEASAYFRAGLEQLDAIGSGDYEFTNELLLFASQMKRAELDERDFHTLSNICELNMGDEPEKFFWGAYGGGLAKAAGLRGLAKLSRWDDRGRIALNNTLLPYLTALVQDGKLAPRDGLALNRLANPVEYYFAGTAEFARAIREKAGPDPAVIGELIAQFQDDNPNHAMDSTVEQLASLAEETFGEGSCEFQSLTAARQSYTQVRTALNAENNNHSTDARTRKQMERTNRSNRAALMRIARETNPADEASLVRAIDGFNSLGNMYDLKGDFFSALRAKLPYAARAQYLRNISALDNLFFYWKFAELKEARQAWEDSSAGLDAVFTEIATPLIKVHAADLIDRGNLSGSNVKEISDFTGVPVGDLVLELVKLFARPDGFVSGAVWLAFASHLCPQADDGQGQLALKRLLASEAARLANKVTDGAWAPGLYPADDVDAIAAGLVWRMLGSPYAVDRWRAAHSIRAFGRFNRWAVIDALVGKLGEKTGGAFQAQELTFYFMHARLWLLVALARLALDFPERVARYKDPLLAVVAERDEPHVLMRSFAARALLACVRSGTLALPPKSAKLLEAADRSPHKRLRTKLRANGGYYSGRPKSAPAPAFQFGLDYEFHKHDVDSLSKVFGKGCWEVADLISKIVKKIDPSAEGMYQTGGREGGGRSASYEMSTRYQTYGQQLGWHALFLAAGSLLETYPVTDDWWYDEPWEEWLGRYGLTRPDGLWLSDGTDRTPPDIAVLLLRRGKKKTTITGDEETLLQLAGLSSRIGKELLIEGRWFSADGVRIRISSALVPSQQAAELARKLAREVPMIAWVPSYSGSEDDDEYLRSEKKDYTPWIVSASGEARLDEHDPYGVAEANLRPRLAGKFLEFCGLTSGDPFNRVWHDKRGRVILRAQVWGREDKRRDEEAYGGTRLFCSSTVLKKILKKYGKDLLVLFNLQRYEQETYNRASQYTHTLAVARISRDLDVEYFRGAVNRLHKSRW